MVVAGTMGVALATFLPKEELEVWGWRVPFLFSLLLVPVGLYVRRRLPETLEMPAKSSIARSLLRENRKIVLMGIAIMVAATVCTQIANYMTTYAISTLKVAAALAQGATVVGGFSMFVAAMFSGYVCDRFGRKYGMIVPLVLLLILIIPCFKILALYPVAITLLSVTALVSALTGAATASSLISIPELLPANARSTGTATIYAVAVMLFGGTAQFIITWLLKTTGSPVAPAYYGAAACAISLIAMVLAPETKNHNVH